MLKNKIIGFADGRKAGDGELITNFGLGAIAAGLVVTAIGRIVATKNYVWYSAKDDVARESIDKLYDAFEEAAKKK